MTSPRAPASDAGDVVSVVGALMDWEGGRRPPLTSLVVLPARTLLLLAGVALAVSVGQQMTGRAARR